MHVTARDGERKGYSMNWSDYENLRSIKKKGPATCNALPIKKRHQEKGKALTAKQWYV